MKAKYLLPCPCGKKITVNTRQAGEFIVCQCGQSLEIPTLLKLKTLELADDSTPTAIPKNSWDVGHRLILLGVLIILGSLAFGGWLYQLRPQDPFANFTSEQIIKVSESISPVFSWRLWQMMEQGGLQRRHRGLEVAFSKEKKQNDIFWGILAVIACMGAGLAVIGVSLVYRPKKILKS